MHDIRTAAAQAVTDIAPGAGSEEIDVIAGTAIQRVGTAAAFARIGAGQALDPVRRLIAAEAIIEPITMAR